jgi:hypothetical protein
MAFARTTLDAWWRARSWGSYTKKASLSIGSLNIIMWVEVSIRTMWPLIQFIPKITSIPKLGSTTKWKVYSWPSILMHASFTSWLVAMLFLAALIQYPPLSIVVIFWSNLDAKNGLIKECEAKESNSIIVGWLLTRNLSAVTTLPVRISSIVVKWACPRHTLA